MTEAIVITGAAGFIGSHLARAVLKRLPSVKIIGVDNFDRFYPRELKLANLADLEGQKSEAVSRFTLVEADIREAKTVHEIFAQHRPAAVFHLAALAGVRPSIADPARYVSVNLDGTINLLEAARHSSCRSFIFASSSSVYGNNKKVPFAETDPINEPISPYAATKAAGELICHTHAHLFNMRIAALRFFTVYGPAQRPDLAIASFMRKVALEEEIPMFGDGSTSRDYTYIDDIVEGVIASWKRTGMEAERHEGSGSRHKGIRHQGNEDAQPRSPHASMPSCLHASPGPFRIYNLGGSSPITLRDMIAQIEEVVGRKAIIRRLPMQPGDVDRTWADLTRSTAELGYKPRTPFIDGLRKQWEWMQGPFSRAPV